MRLVKTQIILGIHQSSSTAWLYAHRIAVDQTFLREGSEDSRQTCLVSDLSAGLPKFKKTQLIRTQRNQVRLRCRQNLLPLV